MRLDFFFNARWVWGELSLRDEDPRFGREFLVIFFFTSVFFALFAFEEVRGFLGVVFLSPVDFLPDERFTGLVGSSVVIFSTLRDSGSAGNSSV